MKVKRIPLSDHSGRWFDLNKAEFYKEESYHNGSNLISKATGHQFIHEAIYLTAGGLFILNQWSDWQGSVETYEIISKEKAAEWFGKQGFDDESIPEVLRNLVNSNEI